MSTDVDLAPISDGDTTEWGYTDTPHYLGVDEDPTAPNKADYVKTTFSDKVEKLNYAATGLTIDDATAIKVTMAYTGEDTRGNADAVEFKLYGDGALKSTKVINVDIGGLDAIGWFVMDLSAPLTQTEADNLMLQKTFLTGAGTGEECPNFIESPA